MSYVRLFPLPQQDQHNNHNQMANQRDSDRESNAAIILMASNAQNSEKISIVCVVSSKGGWYTWINNRRGLDCVKERLDRALVASAFSILGTSNFANCCFGSYTNLASNVSLRIRQETSQV